MNDQLTKNIVQALENYQRDLDYWIGLSDGENTAEGVNCHTCGTPWFKTLEEAERYSLELAESIETARERWALSL